MTGDSARGPSRATSINDGASARTRGGWVPVGTAAQRRTVHAERGTIRGRRTRARILGAARTLFEERGYVDVTIDDIVLAAGVARGTFYTYFTAKPGVFRALSSEVGAAIDEAVASRHGPLTPREGLARSNERYVEVYRGNAQLYGLVEQVASMDDEVRSQRIDRRQAHVRRVAARIRSWQERGYADADVSPDPTAQALVSMTSNSCYWWFVGGDPIPTDPARVITDLWIRAVGLRHRPRASSS